MSSKRKLVVVLVALAAVAVAGGAYAATQSGTGSRQAFLDDAAKRLHVTPQQLRNALRGALVDQLNAAVAAGRLTPAQANAIKQHLRRGAFVPGPPAARFFGRGFGFRARAFGPPEGFGPGRLAAAASYLGITRAQLLRQLMSGDSLAQLAQSHHRSRAGLKAAMLAAVRANLDKAVKAKLITPAQEQKILGRLPARLDAEIAGKGLIAPRVFRLFRGPGGPVGPRGFEPRRGPWPGPGMLGSTPPLPPPPPVY